jgi:hypothetical protein
MIKPASKQASTHTPHVNQYLRETTAVYTEIQFSLFSILLVFLAVFAKGHCFFNFGIGLA